ncbi:EAL domain-containing protein [Shewanella sp. FJAT-52076]|uniref:EAL domain-containing protein n=1 Tax=Shewanella sp. FJAT-52076 TaxID=2864202 RepID=UPI0021AC996E|nr:EAL domain-containing protein [Shewanella sp. FJAT-52076]
MSFLVLAHTAVADPSEDAKFLLDLKYVGVDEGLSQSTVTSVAEDPDGYIWIGTLNGLNRFDGIEFKQYFHHFSNGLSSSFIQSLNVSNGTLFVGTNTGLHKYNRNTDSFEMIAILQEPIWSISSNNEELIIGLNNGIAIYNSVSNSIVYSYRSDNLKGIKQALKIDNKLIIRDYAGEVYSLSEDKIEISDNSVTELAMLENKEIKLKNKTIFIDRLNSQINSDAYSTYNNDLYYITNGSIKVIRNIFKITEQENLGYSPELEALDKAKIYPTKNYFIISNEANGFYIISKNKNYTKKLLRFNSAIWNISSFKEKIIVADDSATLSFLDSNLNVIDILDIGIIGPKTVIPSPQGLYVGTGNGLYSSNGSQKVEKVDDRQFTSGVAVDQTLYLTTAQNSIIALDTTTNKQIGELLIREEEQLLDIEEYNDFIFVAHQGGISKISEDFKEQTLIFSGEITYSIKVINGKLYFSTSNGIYYLTEDFNAVRVFKSTDPIYSIDGDSSTIVATSIGRYYRLEKDAIYSFSSDFGSQNEYNTQSALLIKEHFVAGGMNGISIIPKHTNDKLRETTKTKLTDLSIFNTTVNPGSEQLPKVLERVDLLSLKYSDYPFTIKFKSPASGLKNINYFYRLSGLSENWLSSEGSNQATYTNLSPGKYTFEVYAVNPVTSIPGDKVSLKISVIPPWWMSLEAKIAYALIVLLITSGIIKAALRRREVQRQIAISEERLKLSLWGSGDEMWDWDIETGKIYRSNIWGSLEFPKDGHRSGKDDEESNIHPQDQERVREALNRHFYGETDHFEAAYRVKGKDGHWVWILDRAKIVERDDSENALRMTGTIKNINNFKQAEEQLRLFERAIENISEGMFILDNEFRFVEVNEACCDICLMDKDSFIGTQLQFSCYPDAYSEQVRIILRQQGRWSAEVESRRGDNTTFLMELTVDAIYDEQGTLSHFVGVFSDISRRKQQEEELRKLTNNDLLTGLPNRSNLQVSLNNLVKKDTHHTLMVLDLDNFKKINDSLGHQVGDELLQLVSKRMSAALPGHTSLYRLGGDEFAVLLDKDPDIGSAAAIAKGLVDAFIAPFELAGEKLVVGVSIGIVLYPEDEQNEQALLRKADIAMYHAKSAGGNRYQFYSESLNRNALRQLEVENLIRDGLRDDLFEVYYQPKVDLRNSRMAGMEALVRLNHPTQGLIPPSEFIPLAEETGLIVEIGDLVMRKACFAAQRWREQGLFDGRVAVNLSSRQFALTDLQQRIESILRLTKLPAANLELEITEGTVIKQPEKAIKVMQQLAKMGVSLALDDFGTGYSSLSYLKRFPIHTLKIDKAFVDDIDKSDRDLKMVDSIITIAHNMGLTVVGEGVEVPSQLNILRALKCEEVQGYIYSKAVPEAEFTTLLKQDMGEFLNQKYNQR